MCQPHSSLSSVLEQLQQENAELRASLCTQPANHTSQERLQKDLQRARSKHAAALQQRQQQVAHLEQLTLACQQQLQLQDDCTPGPAAAAATAQQRTTIARLEGQLAATARNQQCAASMQSYLQQAHEQQRQELQTAEAAVQSLTAALTTAQKQLQEAKDQLLVSKASRTAARRALAAAEQQLAQGRASRARFEQQLVRQCQRHDDAHSSAQPSSLWDEVSRLCCAEMPCGLSAEQEQWLQAAMSLVVPPYSAGADDEQQQLPHDGTDTEAHRCLRRLLVCFGASSAAELVDSVRAQLAAAASLAEAAACL